MSNDGSPASPRPTLPGIQELLSDLHFDQQRAQAHAGDRTRDSVPDPRATRVPPFVTDRPEARAPRESWSMSPPSSQSVLTAPRSPAASGISDVSLAGRFDDHRLSASPRTTAAMLPHHSPSNDHVYNASLAARHNASPNLRPISHGSTRGSSALEALREMGLPTYILSADECPPDDDRRHGCGICHRRFNRPSSLRIHMNSHTGDQPFQCPFPGCSRRFSVNSNMRRHYRNHRDEQAITTSPRHYPHQREGHALNTSTPYPQTYYREELSRARYRVDSSPASSSSLSSFSDSDEREDTPVVPHSSRLYAVPQGRTRSASEAYPPRHDRPAPRQRACTVAGCDCNEAPSSALRPAFPPPLLSARVSHDQGTSPRFPPRTR
ncbi:hypothetical protein C8Q79DRAFT_448532 [Trametes meyenii]|nr:hypothetical protein C8Q79DRAFT_448532 [Trametes meyenii]